MPFDVGIGLLLGVLLSNNSELVYPICLVIGIFAVLQPDIDFIYKLVKTGKTPTSEHRDGLHYPLIVLPVLGVVGLMFSPEVAAILVLGAFIHFLHDSVGIGWGIKWLYPFRKNSYLFLFQIKTPTNSKMPKKRFYSWNDSERAEMIKTYGYSDWIKYVYFKPNPFGIFEYSFLVIGIVVAILNA